MFSLALFYIPYSMHRQSLLCLLGLAAYHALCHYALPWLDARFLKSG